MSKPLCRWLSRKHKELTREMFHKNAKWFWHIHVKAEIFSDLALSDLETPFIVELDTLSVGIVLDLFEKRKERKVHPAQYARSTINPVQIS